MSRFAFALFLLPALALTAAAQDYKKMDYGPFLGATYQIKTPKDNNAYRGVALGFDVPAGKGLMSAQAGYIFDTEMLRPAGFWTGGFLSLKGVIFDGGHGSNPAPVQVPVIATKPTPGWDKDGEWKDPREIPYGPLPRDWGRFKGLYRSGNLVVLAYNVGGVDVLEYPELEKVGDVAVLSRTLNIAPATKPQSLVVGDFAGAKGVAAGPKANLRGEVEVETQILVKGDPEKKTKDKMVTQSSKKDTAIYARIQGLDGAALKLEADGRLIATLPAHKDPAKVKISVAVQITPPGTTEGTDLLAAIKGPIDLAPFTKGGPPLWKDEVVTKGERASDTPDPKKPANGGFQNAYVVDSITPPFKNPYDSWFRIGGFDFFKDGRAAVSTWSGDVWIVSGIDDKLDKITWKRFASGIFQPLGLKIVDDKIYTLGRDGLTRLHDFNNDGEADFYETFNNDFMTTANFHEFIFDLHTDKDGNFYFIKGGPVRPGGSGWDRVVPHHGCIMKVSKDGQKFEVVARGFRAPNGMGVGPNGEITCGDNQGTWTPNCPINWVKPGGFYGVPDFAGKPKAEEPKVRDNPLCWLPHNIDNSNGGQVWITGNKFGPLSGQLLHTSYGQSTLFLVLKEEVAGEMQGGVVPLLRFDSGVCRARFHPEQNALYLTGLRGWQTNASKDAGFYRVRYTGKPLNLPVDMHVSKGEIKLTFSDPLDTATAAQTDSYRVDQWLYKWTSGYGSPTVKVSNPKLQGTDEVEVDSALVSPDGKTVTLKIPELRPVMQMKITLNLKAADGTPIRSVIHNTINNVGNLHGEVGVGEFRVIERKQ